MSNKIILAKKIAHLRTDAASLAVLQNSYFMNTYDRIINCFDEEELEALLKEEELVAEEPCKLNIKWNEENKSYDVTRY